MIVFAESDKKDSCVFLLLDRVIEQQEFVARLNVQPGSYAWFLGSRLYDGLFAEALNVSEEWEQYYKPEYPLPEDYLACEYGIEEPALHALAEAIAAGELVLYVDPYRACEAHLAYYLSTEKMRTVLQHIFGGESP